MPRLSARRRCSSPPPPRSATRESTRPRSCRSPPRRGRREDEEAEAEQEAASRSSRVTAAPRAPRLSCCGTRRRSRGGLLRLLLLLLKLILLLLVLLLLFPRSARGRRRSGRRCGRPSRRGAAGRGCSCRRSRRRSLILPRLPLVPLPMLLLLPLLLEESSRNQRKIPSACRGKSGSPLRAWGRSGRGPRQARRRACRRRFARRGLRLELSLLLPLPPLRRRRLEGVDATSPRSRGGPLRPSQATTATKELPRSSLSPPSSPWRRSRKTRRSSRPDRDGGIRSHLRARAP